MIGVIRTARPWTTGTSARMKQTNPPSVEQASPSGGTSGTKNQAEETKDHSDSSNAEAQATPSQQLKPESSEQTQGSLPLGLATAPASEESTLHRDADAGEKPRDPLAVAHAEVPIPPILLEGDEPVAAPDTGPGEKFATASKPDQSIAPEQPITLPETYGTGRLLLTARDPKCLYAHWDVSRQERQEAERSTGGQLVVRVHQQSFSGPVLVEEHLPSGQRHVFVPVESGPGGYVAQLGYYLPEGPWKPLTSSERAVSLQEPGPAKGPVEFATLSFPLTGEATGAASAPRSSPAAPSAEPSFVAPNAAGAPSQTHALNLIPEFPLVRTVPGVLIQAIGTTEPAVSEIEDEEDQSVPIASTSAGSVAEMAWTPASERVLAEIIGRSVLRQKRIGSAEFEALMRGELNWAGFLAQGGVSSMAVAGLSSQDILPAPAEQPGFWLNVNAELVIYGATDPTATVTIAGHRIRLRPDGSFSYRFALPDGSYSLPVEGISADGETRRAELEFYRGTRYSGQVGAHPQDQDLAVPAAENLI